MPRRPVLGEYHRLTLAQRTSRWEGTAPNGWLAQRVMNAVWAKIPIEKIGMDVVVIDGEPHEQPTVTGSSPDAGKFVRSMTSRLESFRWQLMKLDW